MATTAQPSARSRPRTSTWSGWPRNALDKIVKGLAVHP
jgi:hypothetical protein